MTIAIPILLICRVPYGMRPFYFQDIMGYQEFDIYAKDMTEVLMFQ